ncbi:hypothetical protein CLV62_101408 [Dysgonomonas alginatilytica]|uniref:Lipoprotein n=1 Tax=Dysgonomonas alginatilytica TaxID=1605892 RepID=A0A2V3PU48_9BACT|nr:Bor family protein [Dysgonomonas alginatilytica]PXV69139.1 hypothetical protein CLV62_101408 [Dysgonomonas alginatilytica]
MVSKLKIFFIGILIAASFSSCYTTKVTVGDLSPRQPMVKINSEWNHHILWGLVPLGNASMRADDYVGDRTRYMIKTNQSFVNGLVSSLTFGIYTPTTTAYYIPIDESGYDSRDQRPSQSRGSYERARTNELVRGNNQDRYLVEEPAPAPVSAPAPRVSKQQEPQATQYAPVAQPVSAPREYPAEAKVAQQSAAPAQVREVSQSQSGSYKATVYFKNGARMDGTVTHPAGDDNKIELKLPSGLVIESKVSEIEKIVKK